jgi:hypothetical protein
LYRYLHHCFGAAEAVRENRGGDTTDVFVAGPLDLSEEVAPEAAKAIAEPSQRSNSVRAKIE